MKSLALFGRWTNRINIDYLWEWHEFLKDKGIELWVEESFAEAWVEAEKRTLSFHIFRSRIELEKVQVAFAIGGDGAFLDAARIVALLNLPLIGIHAGRLGFLTAIPQERLIPATEDILRGQYTLETRTLLAVTTEPVVFQPHEAFALNEVAFYKAITGEMILIDLYLNGELVNTYWADGVIVSTPTGSTAYSLACGGPIVTPACRNFIITPIAPHSLTVRSLVLPDDGVLTITFRTRIGKVQIALDGNSITVPQDTAVALRRAPTTLKTIKLFDYSYFRTLRDRLSWGVDRRERP
ncbi:MAG: NAD(+)/NADH kinase [Bacteroidia bacterium]|nr:NAD(+)/NADH kinase [Bacteroidia bacterium]MDW8134673.1 NAD(+)/NADH kinase [Bacteroidia bacterium]